MADLPTVGQVESDALTARLEYASHIVDPAYTPAEQRWDDYRTAVDPSLLVGWFEVYDHLGWHDQHQGTIPLFADATNVAVFKRLDDDPVGRAVDCIERHGLEPEPGTPTVTRGRYVFVREVGIDERAWTLVRVRDDETYRSTELTVVSW